MKRHPSTCTRYDYEIHHVDIISAYLEAELKEKIWMQQLSDFESNDSSDVCLLKKIIYDLKQSTRMWYDILKAFLIDTSLKTKSWKKLIHDEIELFQAARLHAVWSRNYENHD